MQENIKELYNKENLTQKDIIQLLLHNAQHMVTRDELKEDNRELKRDLKEDISNLDKKIDSVTNRLDKKIDSVRSELKEDISNLDKKIDSVRSELKGDISNLDKKIDKINIKFDRLQWLIVATIVSIFAKDYIWELIHKFFH